MTKKTISGFSLLFLFAFTFGFAFTLASSAQADQPLDCCDYHYCVSTGLWDRGHHPNPHTSICVNDGTSRCDTVYTCPEI